jgi:starch-binding outer membrane protein, SusD/RagB family
MNKFIKYSLCLLMFSMVSACDNLLDVEANDGRKDDKSFFQTRSDFDSYIFGAYTYLAGSTENDGITNIIVLTNMALNDIVTGDNGVRNELNPLIGPAGSGKPGAYWTDFYNVITRMNTVLDALPNAPISEQEKVVVEGEAKFLRGFSYFYLARAFGGVPLILEPFSDGQLSAPCSPEAEVWQQAIQDLTTAAAALPTVAQWGADNTGRASKGAALAYLANAYMYVNDWPNAEQTSVDLLALGEYELLTNMRDVFSTATPNNKESIFEIQFRDQDWEWGANKRDGSNLPLMTGPGGVLGSWGSFPADIKLSNAFESGDLRRSVLVRTNGETFDFLYFPSQVVTTIPPKICHSVKYFYNRETDWLSGQNIPLMRFAEFKLNYAEILFKVNKTTQAYAQLNDVRQRAGLAPKAFQSNEEVFMTDLMKERRAELNFEPNLWFHYTRTNRAVSFLLQEYGMVIDPKFNKFAIPQSERDQNPTLCQNPGY